MMITNVQTIATCAAVFLLAVTAGCGRQQVDSEDDYDEGRFGTSYQIVTNENPAAPDEPPAILSDSLSVMVSYPGGCEDHEFELESSVSGDSAEVWLRHDGGGDACEAQISDRLQFAVPDEVLAANRIHLVNPESDVPFVLRWDVRPRTRPPASDTVQDGIPEPSESDTVD